MVRSEDIDKLVSLTFDEDPKVRLRAAQVLQKLSDKEPKATLALVELSSDKDLSVRSFAEDAVSGIRVDETFVSLEKLFKAGSSARESENQAPIEELFGSMEERKANTARSLLLPSIEKLFSKMDTERARKIRDKLFPSIERLFSKKPASAPMRKVQAPSDPLKDIERIEHSLLGVTRAASPKQAEAPPEPRLPHSQPEPPEEEAPDGGDGQFLAGRSAPAGIENPEPGESSLFRRALELASTPGITKKMLKKEEKRLIDSYRKEAAIAFKAAILRTQGAELGSLSELRPKMRNIRTKTLTVSAVSESAQDNGAYVRFELSDGSGKYSFYLPHARAKGISIGDIVKLEGALVRKFGKEQALTLDERGNAFIVK